MRACLRTCARAAMLIGITHVWSHARTPDLERRADQAPYDVCIAPRYSHRGSRQGQAVLSLERSSSARILCERSSSARRTRTRLRIGLFFHESRLNSKVQHGIWIFPRHTRARARVWIFKESLSAVLIYNPHLIVNIAVRDSKSRKIV